MLLPYSLYVYSNIANKFLFNLLFKATPSKSWSLKVITTFYYYSFSILLGLAFSSILFIHILYLLQFQLSVKHSSIHPNLRYNAKAKGKFKAFAVHSLSLSCLLSLIVQYCTRKISKINNNNIILLSPILLRVLLHTLKRRRKTTSCFFPPSLHHCN